MARNKTLLGSKDGSFVSRDFASSRPPTVKGAGALKDSGFRIKKGIDLTKPIAEQVLKKATRSAG